MRTKGGTPFRGKDKKLKEREDERENSRDNSLSEWKTEGCVRRLDRNSRGFISLISATKFIYDI